MPIREIYQGKRFCVWGWALENRVGSCRSIDTPERLHSTCNKPWLLHHQYLTDNTGVIDNKREIFQCNEASEILHKVDYWRWTSVQLITYAYTCTLTFASRFGFDYWWLFINLYKWKTIKVPRVTSMYFVIPFGIKVLKGIK